MNSAEAVEIASWVLTRLQTAGIPLPSGITVLAGSLAGFRRPAVGAWFAHERLLALDHARIVGDLTGREAVAAIVNVVLHEAAHASIAPCPRSPHGRRFQWVARRIGKVVGITGPVGVADARRWPS